MKQLQESGELTAALVHNFSKCAQEYARYASRADDNDEKARPHWHKMDEYRTKMTVTTMHVKYTTAADKSTAAVLQFLPAHDRAAKALLDCVKNHNTACFGVEDVLHLKRAISGPLESCYDNCLQAAQDNYKHLRQVCQEYVNRPTPSASSGGLSAINSCTSFVTATADEDAADAAADIAAAAADAEAAEQKLPLMAKVKAALQNSKDTISASLRCLEGELAEPTLRSGLTEASKADAKACKKRSTRDTKKKRYCYVLGAVCFLLCTAAVMYLSLNGFLVGKKQLSVPTAAGLSAGAAAGITLFSALGYYFLKTAAEANASATAALGEGVVNVEAFTVTLRGLLDAASHSKQYIIDTLRLLQEAVDSALELLTVTVTPGSSEQQLEQAHFTALIDSGLLEPVIYAFAKGTVLPADRLVTLRSIKAEIDSMKVVTSALPQADGEAYCCSFNCCSYKVRVAKLSVERLSRAQCD
jgi:hypothetical protein